MSFECTAQEEIVSADGELLGYVVPAADAQHLLTFDGDFEFIGVADSIRSARLLIDEYLGQALGPRIIPMRRHLREVA